MRTAMRAARLCDTHKGEQQTRWTRLPRRCAHRVMRIHGSATRAVQPAKQGDDARGEVVLKNTVCGWGEDVA